MVVMESSRVILLLKNTDIYTISNLIIARESFTNKINHNYIIYTIIPLIYLQLTNILVLELLEKLYGGLRA